MRTLAVAVAIAWTLIGVSSDALAQEPRDPLTSTALAEGYAEWTELAPGLELRAFEAAQPSRFGDQLIVALRIDPARYEFVLTVAAAEGGLRRTARNWAAEQGFVAATNAGMFQASRDELPVGFTRAEGVTVNPVVTSDRTAFAFGSEEAGVASPTLLDRDCDDFDSALPAYENVIQSIRMISCDGHNVWSQQPREWSTAALATDAEGRVLFVHVRSPYSVHDLIAMLQASSLGIERAMYLEGGPEATLFATGGGVTVERVGSFETGFNENDDNAVAWPLPNVIGVRPRADLN